ncbi:MAG: YqaA family protein [Bacteroidota bacterium]
MSFFEVGYTGLFLISFLSATILPIASEGVLAVALMAGLNPWMCLLVASSGNILGGTSNYWLGRVGKPLWLRKLGFNADKIVSFQKKIEKYGYWLATLSWVPVIGDPLLVALGYFRSPWWKVFALMSIAKIVRYLILILAWIMYL